MKTFSVSLVVTNPSLSLADLSQKLGRAYSSGSHSTGEAVVGREGEKRIWPQTLWRFDSGARETAPVEEHLARLEFQLPPKELLRALPPGSKISIDIAVFFDTMTVSYLLFLYPDWMLFIAIERLSKSVAIPLILDAASESAVFGF